MKKKENPVRSLESETRRKIHEFIDVVAMHGDCPSMWPLTREEQVIFVRKAIFEARKIRAMDGYKQECVLIASEDLSMAS